MGTQKSCTNVDHIAQERWKRLLVDADCHACCQAIHKGTERETGEELYDHYEEMSKAAGVEKQNENPKAKALWNMKVTKHMREDFHDPESKDNIQGIN